jgi:betaine/carnitine transporter, BCCT family
VLLVCCFSLWKGLWSDLRALRAIESAAATSAKTSEAEA